MVNNKQAKRKADISTKARLLMGLREKSGAPQSGEVLAKSIGVSRVAVWKGIQSLIEAGYAIETLDAGYALDPAKERDFLYPWEFGGKEAMFRHFDSTGSTMDRARELADQGAEDGTVITAEKQTEGRGRNGRAWASGQGGLFFTVLERPRLAMADYVQPSLVLQIAAARALSAMCGVQARLRWPNDIYIGKRKIAGVITEIAGEGDMVNWLAGGVGINVNNPAPAGNTTACAEIVGHQVSRRELLRTILAELEKAKSQFNTGADCNHGNSALAAEWNSMADCIGAKAAVIDTGYYNSKESSPKNYQNRFLACGVFGGIDSAGRCIIKTGADEEALHFSPGPVSIIF